MPASTPASSDAIARAITDARDTRGIAVTAYLTGGYPDPASFRAVLMRVLDAADVVEVGVPFSDPMADGVTISRASAVAVNDGVTLRGLLDLVGAVQTKTPIVFMSYLNPILALGIEPFAAAAATHDVAGVIIPDLPMEEASPYRAVLDDADVSLVQLVTPATPAQRLRAICRASRGFTYAVTMTGTTGGHAPLRDEIPGYLARVRAASPVPVQAGFGIRSPEQVRQLVGHADGVIVGSALIEAIDRGDDPAALLRHLRNTSASVGDLQP